MIFPLKNINKFLPNIGSPADFGYQRSFYYHSGIDLYCESGQEIIAIEDGKVVKIDNFTGSNAIPPSPWWNNTFSILIEGLSGVLGYCEILPHKHIYVGLKVMEAESLGIIIPVLKRNKGNGTSMLHLEHYSHNTIEHVEWLIGKEKPINLINPREIISNL